MNTAVVPDRTTSTIRRIARIWSVVILIFAALIIIMEIIESLTMELEPYPWVENLQPIAMLIGVIGLALAWRWECLGGAVAVVFAILVPILYTASGGSRPAIPALLALSVVIPGVLFLICWWRSR